VLGRTRVAQLGERLGLDLTNPLPCEVEPPTDLVERQRPVVVQPETKGEDRPLPLVEVAEQSPQTLEQVGIGLGITRERVRQLEARALRELRQVAPGLQLYLSE